jgi:sRNA-binding protein
MSDEENLLPRADKINRAVLTLIENFPACFTEPLARKPIKVGIAADIAAAIEPGDVSSPLARRYKFALRKYTTTRSYLASVIMGAPRIDLHGEPAGVVTEREAAWAAIQLGHLRARRHGKQKSKHDLMLSARRVLLNKWPKCFMPFGRPKKPLKRGILADIKQRMDPNEWASLPFEYALYDYRTGQTYTDNCIDGAPCVDLDGIVSGYIGEIRAPKIVAPVPVPTKDAGSHDRASPRVRVVVVRKSKLSLFKRAAS